jgi:hypothetical protein
MNKSRLINIFGKNLLDDESKIEAFKELSGLSGHKPWECVGEILEAAASLYTLSKQEIWAKDKIIARLRDELVQFYGVEKLEKALDDFMQKSEKHLIPKEIYEKVMPYAI